MFGPTIFAMEDVVARRALDQRGFYRMLEAYYLNNGLYEVTRPELFAGGMTTRGNKGLRNPANRSVEFHVTHTWPGSLQKSLPLLAANPNLAQPLQQVWAWSNWAVKKQLAVRWFAMFGDWFCKVATSSAANGAVQRVYLQNIKPEWVSDFETDERGNITMIRLDMPLEKANATLTSLGKDYLPGRKAVYVANIHGMPGIGRMFALPKMKKYSHRIILGDDAALIAHFPAQTGKVTVLALSDGKVKSIKYWTPGTDNVDTFLK